MSEPRVSEGFRRTSSPELPLWLKRLHFPHRGEQPRPMPQFLGCSGLNDAPAINDYDLAGIYHGLEPMGHHNQCTASAETLECGC